MTQEPRYSHESIQGQENKGSGCCDFVLTPWPMALSQPGLVSLPYTSGPLHHNSQRCTVSPALSNPLSPRPSHRTRYGRMWRWQRHRPLTALLRPSPSWRLKFPSGLLTDTPSLSPRGTCPAPPPASLVVWPRPRTDATSADGHVLLEGPGAWVPPIGALRKLRGVVIVGSEWNCPN